LLEYIETIADKIRNSQYGESAHVKVSAPFSFVSPVRGWKKGKDKLSLDTIWLSASVDGTATPNKSVGVAVDNMTACPCVQQTYKHTLEETKGDVREAILTVAPLLTHSQRCKTEVEIVNAIRFPSVREILDVLDGVLVRVQNTLPREHELALVYRAHRDPQFVEDVVRSVMAGIFKLMKSDNQDTTIKVDSVGQESIHGFDIHAATSSTVSELARILSD
jgi:GTP cyclohydrolase FolE2